MKRKVYTSTYKASYLAKYFVKTQLALALISWYCFCKLAKLSRQLLVVFTEDFNLLLLKPLFSYLDYMF